MKSIILTRTSLLLMFILSLIQFSCSKEEVPDIITNPVKESTDVYEIEVGIYGTFEDEENTFVAKEFKYQYSKDGLKDLSSNSIVSDLELKQILRNKLGQFTSCSIPLESIRISIEKTAGESTNIQNLALKFNTIPDDIEIFNSDENTKVIDEISFTIDANNPSLAELNLEIRNICETDEGSANARIDKSLSASLKSDNNDELFEFKQTITLNEYNRLNKYNLLQFSNAKQSEDKQNNVELPFIEGSRPIWSTADVTEPIEISRIHTYGQDNCSQPLAFISLDYARWLKSWKSRLYRSPESTYTLYTYSQKLLEEHPSINSNLSTTLDNQDLVGGELSFDFNCSSTADVDKVFYLVIESTGQYHENGVAKGEPSIQTAIVVPIGVKVDVQGAP